MSFLSNLFGGGSSPPSAPDPTVTAGAQQQTNINTAIANARLNRINQQTPWGSINYTEGAKDANGVPTYSSQIQLSPQQQALFDQQQQQQQQRGNLSQGLLDQAGGSLSHGLDFSALHPMYDRYAPQGQSQPAPQRQSSPDSQALIAKMEQLFAQRGGAHQDAVPQAAQLAQALRGGSSPQPGAAPTVPVSAAGDSPGLTYADYQRLYGNPSASSEGSQSAPMSEAQWNSMAPRARYKEVAQFGTPEASADQIAAFKAKFGDLKGGAGGDNWQGFGWSYDKPGTWFGDQPSEYMVDPSRVMEGKDAAGNPIYVSEKNNFKGDWMARQQATDDRRSNQHMLKGTAAIAAMLGGGMLAEGAMGGAGVGLAGDESAGLSMANPFTSGAPVGEAASAGPGWATEGGLPVQGAPVSEASTQAAQPSWLQRGMTNFQQGRGFLGLNPAQRAGAALLPMLLRNMGNQQGGNK